MPIEVESIYRYPVKGLNGEPLDRVALARGQGLPWDRCFALARGDAKLDASSPHWLPKERFVMLMRDADLARLACSFDIERRTIELRASGKAARRGARRPRSARRNRGLCERVPRTAARGAGALDRSR